MKQIGVKDSGGGGHQHQRPGLIQRHLTRGGVAGAVAALLAGAAAGLLPGCDTPNRPKARAVEPIVRDVPQPMRGTIGAEATLGGTQRVLVSGYGLVVGLNGTGGLTLPDAIAETMEREMARQGLGLANNDAYSPLAGRTPADILRDRNVAVVTVQAAVPPGSPTNMPFDVYVRAVNATDLEGGRLWTTDLRLQAQAGRPALFGEGQGRKLAEAKGPVFINPFGDPDNTDVQVTRTTGRILGARLGDSFTGGRVTDPLLLSITLDNESHARARAMVSAVNSRFPETPYDGGPIATGRSGTTIALRVPYAYRERPTEFVQLVRALPISDVFEPERARRVALAMKAEPFLAPELAWQMEAMGEKSLPFLRELYDYGESRPRIAALRAGARLGDPLTVEPLVRMARTTVGPERLDAIALLGRVRSGPEVDLALRDLLADDELLVRVSAYEALALRAERAQLGRLASVSAANPNAVSAPPLDYLEQLSERNLPRGTLQGVERRSVRGKFYLDLVEGGTPLVYVTQSRAPRIVIFGAKPALNRPSFASAWSDRLLVTAEDTGPVRLYYRDYRTDRVVQTDAPAELAPLIEFMAHTPTPEEPEPGLGMSFSEVVGALYSISQSKATNAAFATERDRLIAELTEAATADARKERPETTTDSPDIKVFSEPKESEKPARPTGPTIVPIPREAKPAK